MNQAKAITILSVLTAIFGCAGLTATNDLAYLVILVTACIGMIAGVAIMDELERQAEAEKEFNNRLNK